MAWNHRLTVRHRLEAYATLIFRRVERCYEITCREIREPRQPRDGLM